MWFVGLTIYTVQSGMAEEVFQDILDAEIEGNFNEWFLELFKVCPLFFPRLEYRNYNWNILVTKDIIINHNETLIWWMMVLNIPIKNLNLQLTTLNSNNK